MAISINVAKKKNIFHNYLYVFSYSFFRFKMGKLEPINHGITIKALL